MSGKLGIGSLLAAAAACGLICGACGPRQNGSRETCSGFEIDVEKIFTVEVRAQVMGYGGSLGTDVVNKVVTRMDDVLRDYVYLSEAACRDHSRGLLTDEEYKQKIKCFDGFLQRQRTLVNALASGDANAVQSLGLSADGQGVLSCQ